MPKPVLFALLLCLTPAFGAEKGPDFEKEKKQIEKEDAEQKAEREKGIKGKYQKMFYGRLNFLEAEDTTLSPDVIGSFETNEHDKKPGRQYLLKVAGDDPKLLLQALKKLEGKNLQITGKLRFIGSDGEAKYLVALSAEEIGPTPAIPERRSANGL
jgi:hypothetical protein